MGVCWTCGNAERTNVRDATNRSGGSSAGIGGASSAGGAWNEIVVPPIEPLRHTTQSCQRDSVRRTKLKSYDTRAKTIYLCISSLQNDIILARKLTVLLISLMVCKRYYDTKILNGVSYDIKLMR